MINSSRLIFLIALSAISVDAYSQKKASPPKKVVPAANQTKGRAQQAGGPGVFGTTYSLTGTIDNFNASLDKAWYDVAPPAATQAYPRLNEKYLYMQWSFKNTSSGSKSVGADAMSVSVVFADGNTKDDYVFLYRNADQKQLMMDFKPGQGINDAIGYVVVPADARVTKIILNCGRAGVPNEKVIRYFIVGGGTDTKPDPKNEIAPLPAVWRDPSDTFGAKALENATAEIGKEYYFSIFAATVESLALTNKFGDITASEDQQLLVATVKIRNPLGSTISFGTTGMREGLELTLVDGDGESTNVTSPFYKASREEPVGDHEINAGDSYRIRVVFAIRKVDKPLKSVRLRESEFKSRGVVFDGSKVNIGK